ncbi:MAG: thiamine pyrophosphate-dependent dehydrogenase E1 component subunit alpha [Planctomycetota bacterium]
MKRHVLYDPPEYLEWAPDPQVMSAYRRVLKERPGVRAALERLGHEGVGRLYRGLLRNRLHDIALKRWVRTGVLTKAWLGTGEEAVTVGAVHGLEAGDVVGPMIRNAAACFERGIPLVDCLRVSLASGDTITRGRDLHIGDLERGVVCPISHVGDLVPVLAGFALAFALRRTEGVALTWVGEGATRTGAAHEGLAIAASRALPLIVVVQDNQVALGTRRGERLEASIEALAAAHGSPGLECDGNHVLDVFCCVRRARRLCVEGAGPVIIHARTFRMGGHATHDEAEGRALFDEETFRAWGARDPIGCFEEFLKGEEGLLKGDPDEILESWERQVTEEVEAAVTEALRSRDESPADPTGMEGDVLASPPPAGGADRGV